MIGYDSESVMIGIPGFDAALGTLNKVTLDVSVIKYRSWQVRAPSGTACRSPGARALRAAPG